MSSAPRAFVVGHPIAHSRSPMLHSYWLRRYGIAGSYERIDVAPSALGDFVTRLRRDGWAGGNVTVPHKIAIMPLADRLDDAAKAIGAVNTLWFEDGDLVGGNTDALGFLGNLDQQAPGWEGSVARATILGAGGAARAAVYGLLSRGIAVDICNRTAERASQLAADFPASSGHGLDALPRLLAATDLLVNTTSLGMAGQPPLDIDLAPLKHSAIVHDTVYVPLETRLLRDAARLGHRTVDGLGMLLHQAVPGFERWFGRAPEVTAELRETIAADIRAKHAAA